MKLEVGKYYRTRDDRTIGPMRESKIFGGEYWSDIGGAYHADGSHVAKYGNDIIAERNDAPEVGPVRTVTRQEVVPGVYGKVDIESLREDGRVDIMVNACMTSEDLTDAIQTLTAIRDAMQANTTA